MLEIKQSRIGNVVVLAPAGRLDSVTSPQLQALLPDFKAPDVKGLLFDCAGLEYASSAGLRVFLLAARQAQGAGSRTALANVNQIVAEILAMAGFDSILPVHADVLSAARALERAE